MAMAPLKLLPINERTVSEEQTPIGKDGHLDSTWHKYSRVVISENNQQPDKEDITSCVRVQTRLGFHHLDITIPADIPVIVNDNDVCICKLFSSLCILEPVRRCKLYALLECKWSEYPVEF